MKHLHTLTFAFPVCLSVIVACGDGDNQPTTTTLTTPGTTTDDEEGDDDDGETPATPASNPTTGSTPTTGDDGTASDSSATQDPTTGPAGETTVEVTLTGPSTEPGTDTTAETGTDTDATTDTPVCGDGVMDGTEACDDGNDVDGDGCESNCTNTPVCGNNKKDVGEACDDGNTDDGDECSADCKKVTSEQVCGNGTVELPEVCDDGNTDDGDGCDGDCSPTPADCGNTLIEAGEQCDDGNQVDDDFCTNDCKTHVPAMCQAPAMYKVCDDALDLANKADKTQAHKAMGICSDAADNSVVITNYQFNAPDNASWQIAKGFGSYTVDADMNPQTPKTLLYSPREGATMLLVSTGVISPPNMNGVVTEAFGSQEVNNDNSNPDNPNTMPAPLSDKVGSANGNGGMPFKQCDSVHDCSDTLYDQWNVVTNGQPDPNDKLFFRFNAKVPEGTFGYKFDFVFCSSEYPFWVGTEFNDMFIVWQTDPTPDNNNVDPPIDAYTGNITFVPDPNNPDQGLPLTITALSDYYAGPGYSDAEPQLAGTGFESHGCSDWFTAKGGVQPGANLNIGFFLTDMGDTALATLAIIDNFRWDCQGCIPSEVNDCGVQPPQ